MKRVASMSGGQRTDYGETGLFIEQRIAHDQSRTTSLLLMAGVRVEGNGDEIPLPRRVRFHLPGLSADRFAPIRFLGLVAPGDA